MIASKADTQHLIPQRPPFVMVDELLSSDEASSRSSFLVRADNVLLDGDNLSAAGLLENIAQTAAARAGYEAAQENKPVMVGYIGAVKNFDVARLPQPGDLLETEVVVENQVFNVTLIRGIVRHESQVLASCEMKIFLTPTT